MTESAYGEVLTQLALRDPDRVAVVCGEESVTRADLEARANRIARGMASRGVRQGDRVTLDLSNGIPLVASCLATWKLGAVPNPISPRLPAREREAIVARAAPRLLLTETPLSAAGSPRQWCPDWSDRSSDATPLPPVLSPHERALASGGSTGLPKLIVAARPALYDPETASPLFKAKNAALIPGPIQHAAPFSACFQGIFAGAKVVVMPRFDAKRCLEAIERHRVDRMQLVPTMMLRISRLDPEIRSAADVSSLRFVLTGGAPCPAWLMREWIEWLGADVMHEAYGPSERIGGTFITGREWLEHPGSVGRPVSTSQLRIQDPETGRVLGPGEMGEIYFLPRAGRGSTYHYVGAQARSSEDGWESVGDMGYLDPDGYLFLGDRRSDMILCGGRNLYPAEIEAAVEEHPAVRSCAVIGLPDEDLGSYVHAIVEVPAETTADSLRAHAAERLARYKVPRDFEIVGVPLRDDAGKVRRQALRNERLPK